MKTCIGLFGTCGNSKWREAFISEYQKKNIDFFNPQVADWKPENAVIEAEHLAQDAIVLFPVTGESYGTASLAEIGFAILSIAKDKNRHVIIFVEPEVDAKLTADNPVAAKESTRSRTLVNAHLKKLLLSNVHRVESLGEMLNLSVSIRRAIEDSSLIDKF